MHYVDSLPNHTTYTQKHLPPQCIYKVHYHSYFHIRRVLQFFISYKKSLTDLALKILGRGCFCPNPTPYSLLTIIVNFIQ